MNTSRLLLAALTLGFASLGWAQHAGQGPRRGFGPHGPGAQGRGGLHLPPVVATLDANSDGTLSADEIAQAPARLLTLDQNGDGQLTFAELHPGRPANAPTPPAGAPMLHRGNPVMLALDANADGTLSASEIANAATSLAALDGNKDGQLTRDELRPLPPQP